MRSQRAPFAVKARQNTRKGPCYISSIQNELVLYKWRIGSFSRALLTCVDRKETMFRSLGSKKTTIIPLLSLFMLVAAVVLTGCGGGGGGGGHATPTCPPCSSTETSFWAIDFTVNSLYCVCAAEVSVGAQSRIFVEHGMSLPAGLAGMPPALQTEFDTKIYPIDTANFGREPNPGIDGDPKITILLLNIRDGFNGTGGYVAGYFDPSNEYPLSAYPYSNQREMFFMNINPLLAFSPTEFYTTLAHEFQHMIHWEQKTRLKNLDDDTWLDEAMSEAAPTDPGLYGPSCARLYTYEQDPSNSLTDWQGTVADYGIAYMWSQYFREQFGMSIFKSMMTQTSVGITSVNQALSAAPSVRTFESTFYDLSIAIASGQTTTAWWPGHPEWTYSSIETWPNTCEGYPIPGIFNEQNFTTLPALGPWSIAFSSYTPTTISATTGTITWTAAPGPLEAAFIDYGHSTLTTSLVSGVSYSYDKAGLLIVSNPSGGAVTSGGTVVRTAISVSGSETYTLPSQMLNAANWKAQEDGKPRGICVHSVFTEREKELRQKGFRPGF